MLDTLARSLGLYEIVEALTGFGNVVVLGTLSLWLAIWMAVRVDGSAARRWLMCVALTGLATALPKIWLAGCGQSFWQIHSPSGHSSFSAVAYGGLAVVLSVGETPARRVLIALLAAAWVALIGWSRVVVHAHTAEEVYAGLAIGTLGALLFGAMYRAQRRPGVIWSLPAAMLVFIIASVPKLHLTMEPWLRLAGTWLNHHTPMCQPL